MWKSKQQETDWRGEDTEEKAIWIQRQRMEWCQQPLEAKEAQNRMSLRSSRWSTAHTLISDFWPPELWKNEFLLWAIQCVVISYGSPRKPLHLVFACYPFWYSSGHLVALEAITEYLPIILESTFPLKIYSSFGIHVLYAFQLCLLNGFLLFLNLSFFLSFSL